jgi:hypothetical protein
MPFDSKHPLTPMERAVFGDSSYRHEITGEPVEIGEHAHPPDVQAALVHVLEIERRECKAAADEVRQKLSMHIKRRSK